MALNWQTGYHRYRRYFVDLGQLYRQKKTRVYTEIVLSIFTTAFFLFFAIKPTVVTITGLLKETKDKKMVVEKLEEKVNALNLAQREYQSLQTELYLVDQALPQEAKISLLLKQLEALALKAQVNVEAIQYSTVTLRGEISRSEPQGLGFNLAVSGDYQNLREFLHSLNDLRRIILLDAFSFKIKKAEEQKLILTLSAKALFLEEGNERI